MLEFLKKYFNKERKDIYCQNCGENLNYYGGDVSESGRVYCHGHKLYNLLTCFEQASFLEIEPLEYLMGHTKPSDLVEFRSDDGIQKLIRKGKVTHFGRLERRVLARI